MPNSGRYASNSFDRGENFSNCAFQFKTVNPTFTGQRGVGNDWGWFWLLTPDSSQPRGISTPNWWRVVTRSVCTERRLLTGPIAFDQKTFSGSPSTSNRTPSTRLFLQLSTDSSFCIQRMATLHIHSSCLAHCAARRGCGNVIRRLKCRDSIQVGISMST